MIVYKRWQDRRRRYDDKNWDCDGWLLFGLIPLYIRRVEVVRA